LVALLAALLAGCGAAATAIEKEFNPDPVLQVGPISSTTSHEIAKLDHVASVLAGRRHTIVNCWTEDDWAELSAWNSEHHNDDVVDAAGVTWLRTRRIELSPFVCEVLKQTLAKSALQPLFESFAITVLAHESAHASGVRAEWLAECSAMEIEPRAAVLLGIPKAQATRFQHIYRGTVYPYEEARYRSSDCQHGLPGVLVPDTLGSAIAFRPLQRTATAVVDSLPNWKDVEGGSGAFGPLSHCAPIADRTLQAARYRVKLLGPSGSSVDVSSVRLRTQHVFDHALIRFRAEPPCTLAQLRTRIGRLSLSASVALAPVPRAITDLSPEVRAFRYIWTEHGKRFIDDSIFIFDPATLEVPNLSFDVLAGTVPLAVEVRAVKAALRTLR